MLFQNLVCLQSETVFKGCFFIYQTHFNYLFDMSWSIFFHVFIKSKGVW